MHSAFLDHCFPPDFSYTEYQYMLVDWIRYAVKQYRQLPTSSVAAATSTELSTELEPKMETEIETKRNQQEQTWMELWIAMYSVCRKKTACGKKTQQALLEGGYTMADVRACARTVDMGSDFFFLDSHHNHYFRVPVAKHDHDQPH
jgi:hypothetical protein